MTWWEAECEGERRAAAREAGRGERRRRPMRRTRLSRPLSIAPAAGWEGKATGRERGGEAARDGAGRNGMGAREVLFFRALFVFVEEFCGFSEVMGRTAVGWVGRRRAGAAHRSRAGVCGCRLRARCFLTFLFGEMEQVTRARAAWLYGPILEGAC